MNSMQQRFVQGISLTASRLKMASLSSRMVITTTTSSAISGLADYLAHRLPTIQSPYKKKGDLDKKSSRGQGQPTLSKSRSLYASDPLQQRRIELILGHFLENVKSFPSNSTEGYLAESQTG